jgi:serine/threonine protein phosphatase PrpC
MRSPEPPPGAIEGALEQAMRDEMELPSWIPGADQGTRRDTGDPDDFGAAGDVGAATDVGAAADAGTAADAGAAADAGTAADAGEIAGQPEPRFPPPAVIGQPPSFGPFLGPPPESPAATSGLAVPDTVLDGAELPGLTIRGASLRGDDHHARQEVRQDSMGMWRISDGETAAILVCAADGVGSQPLSHLGAAHACAALRKRLGRVVTGLFQAADEGSLTEFCQDVIADVGDAIDDVAGQQGVDPKALSTTLAAAVIEASPAHEDERRYVILNVGDATAFVLRDGEFLACLADGHDAAAPIASTGTWALPASVGPVGTAAGTIGPRDMLMVCTDGMSNPMLNRDVRDQLARWWGGDTVPGLPEFGWQLSYRVRTFSDDRTAVCVWGRGQ